jgi:hypothetical protein
LRRPLLAAFSGKFKAAACNASRRPAKPRRPARISSGGANLFAAMQRSLAVLPPVWQKAALPTSALECNVFLERQ